MATTTIPAVWLLSGLGCVLPPVAGGALHAEADASVEEAAGGGGFPGNYYRQMKYCKSMLQNIISITKPAVKTYVSNVLLRGTSKNARSARKVNTKTSSAARRTEPSSQSVLNARTP